MLGPPVSFFYSSRDIEEKESAIELAILSSEGKISRVDKSVNYNNLEFAKGNILKKYIFCEDNIY